MTTRNNFYTPSRVSIKIRGSREWATLLWALGLCAGGMFFFNKGLASYIGDENIVYVPQGIFLVFYGTLALILSGFFLASVLWDVGSGTCTMDRNRDLSRLLRLNFPGKYRFFEMTFLTSGVQSVNLDVQSGLFPRRVLALTISSNSIPLNSNQELVKITTMETLALALAKWLDVGFEWRESG